MAEAVPPEQRPIASRISRRRVLGCAACIALGGAGGWLLRDQTWGRPSFDSAPGNPEEALEQLREGNQRFVAGNARHRHQSKDWRNSLVTDQRPFAIVLACSDSRVPVEMVFDQGFGDLFVIRVAGNVISTDVVGSIVYGVTHLHTQLLVVLGHEGCGAVTAALNAPAAAQEPASIEALVSMIGPGLRNLDPHLQGAARLHAAVEANVRWSMRQLTDLPSGRAILDSRPFRMVGAVYDLATSQVRFLNP
jgi:carbonic anhydrase